MKECLICGNATYATGCDKCGRLIFRDNAKLIVNDQNVPVFLIVTNKKISINVRELVNIKPKFGQLFRSALLNQFGILGRYADSKVEKNQTIGGLIDINSIKNCVFPYGTKIDENCISIQAESTQVLHIENEANREALVNLLKKYSVL